MTLTVFKTPGKLDLNALCLFGINSKPNSESPIGFFGTGLKYAVAVALRFNQKVWIYTDGKEYRVELATKEIFRDKEFQRVLLFETGNSEPTPLPFTLELGKHWELWMAFRELWSNTHDENGTWFTAIGTPNPMLGTETYIIVEGEEFVKVADSREAILDLDHLRASTGRDFGKIPFEIYRDNTIEVYNCESSVVYYRGIRAHTLDKPSIYTYNILSPMDLTEDRTIKYTFYMTPIIAVGIVKMRHKDAIKRILTANENLFENKLQFTDYNKPSTEFLAAASDLTKERRHGGGSYEVSFNDSARDLMMKTLGEEPEYPRLQLDATDLMVFGGVGEDLHRMGFDSGNSIYVVDVKLDDMLAVKHKEDIQIPKDIWSGPSRALLKYIMREYMRVNNKGEDFLFDQLINLSVGKDRNLEVADEEANEVEEENNIDFQEGDDEIPF